MRCCNMTTWKAKMIKIIDTMQWSKCPKIEMRICWGWECRPSDRFKTILHGASTWNSTVYRVPSVFNIPCKHMYSGRHIQESTGTPFIEASSYKDYRFLALDNKQMCGGSHVPWNVLHGDWTENTMLWYGWALQTKHRTEKARCKKELKELNKWNSE